MTKRKARHAAKDLTTPQKELVLSYLRKKIDQAKEGVKRCREAAEFDTSGGMKRNADHWRKVVQALEWASVGLEPRKPSGTGPDQPDSN